MTALTPEKMRALADRRLAAQNDWASSRGWQEEADAVLRAAADEVDRLRAEADDVYRSGYALGGEHAKAKTETRLLAVIGNAPHEWTCPARQGEHLTCLCWKADVL